MDRIEDRKIEPGDVPVRVYLPPNLAEDPAPAVVYFHGGGWVQGDLDSHHALCTLIAQRVPCRVLSVDYRLAPEHPFPAAVDDALAAYRWTVAHAAQMRIDPKRIAVMGDSAGGNLATVTCLQMRDLRRQGVCDDPPPCVQVLLYPVTDLPRGGGSYEAFGQGFALDDATMRWFYRHYLGNDVGDENGITDARVAPLRADDLSELPPALVATAYFDVLRDECVEYAQALERAGCDVWHSQYKDQVHAFANLTGVVPSARAAMDEICSELAYRFHQLES
jgi:acetyl esterase